MPSFVRLAAAALALVSGAALAQTAVPPTTTVQQLAPQLVTFAGSPLNFNSLVNGLAAGGPVQLVTVLPNGFSQVVTFTPTGALAAADIARVLETARQQLISLGVATPTAEQIGFTLMGGIVPTALGGTNVSGVLNPQNPISPAAQIQRNAAAGGSASFSPQPPASTSATSTLTPAPGVTSSVNVQFIPNATVAPGGTTTATTTGPAAQVRNTSDSPFPAGATSFSPATGSTSTTPADTTTPPTLRATPPAAGTPPPAGRPARQ
jgi:hypothetical protein